MMTDDNYDDYLKKYNEFLRNLGTYEGYSGENCKNCGRNRVEMYSSGKLICEKCGYDQDTEDYDYDYCYYYYV